jgi:hypothetical protein
MAHQFESPPALEMLLTRLDELAIVVGPAAALRLGAVRERLQQALALRARGDASRAVAVIGQAMEDLAALADQLDRSEGTIMRAAVQQFGAALVRGVQDELERAADVMRERSGATKVERKR